MIRIPTKTLRQPSFLITVIFLILLHGGLVYLQVPRIETMQYNRHAIDLKVCEKWRYGYFLEYHGAHLVKTPNVSGAKPPARPDYEENNEDSALSAVMLHKLNTYPAKAAFETFFYLSLIAYSFFLLPWLRNRLIPAGSKCWRKVGYEGVAWALLWTLLCLPILVFDYGSSAFTTWGGAGASGFSGPYPGMGFGFAGETISYRPLLETLGGIPLMVVISTGLGVYLPEMSTGSAIWISGVLFYAAAACLICGALTYTRSAI